MKIIVKDIAIDLVPMHSGGINGGAKGFIIDLIRSLAKANKRVIFNCYCRSEIEVELKIQLKHENIKLRIVDRLNKYFWNSYNSKILFCPFGKASFPTRNLPILSILYDLQVNAYPQFFSRAERRNREKQIQYIKKNAHSIVTISEFTRQMAIEYGFNDKNINVIPINIDSNKMGKIRDSALMSNRFRDIILYPANLWKHKNHELLFTAFTMAKEKGLSPNIRLVCTGFGVEKRTNYLNSIIRGMKKEKNIILTGYVDEKTLNDFYNKSMYVIFPSLYEGFGMPVIEAMSIGVPVCCSNTTALKEVSNDAAMSFDPRNPSSMADVMCRLASNNTLRSLYIEKGYKRALIYSNREEMVEKYSKVINQTYLRSITS